MSQKPKHKLVSKYIPKEFQELADSAYDHIGDILKKTSLEELLLLVYVGYSAFQKNLEIDLKVAQEPSEEKQKILNEARPNILQCITFAELGYKLATAPNGGGTPPVAQVTGVAMMTGTGLIPFVTGEIAPANTIQGFANRLVKWIETGKWLE